MSQTIFNKFILKVLCYFKWYYFLFYFVFHWFGASIERVTGRKARGLQTEEIGCKCQTFLSLLSGRRKQTGDIFFLLYTNLGFPGGSEVKASACNMGDLGRSPGEENGNSLQYSCLENPMDGGPWWATVHGVTESDRTEQLNLT